VNIRAVTRKIEQALRGLQYGTVQMIIHDGEVVRIERTERIRLTATAEALDEMAGRPTRSEDPCNGE
jgi:hypothetical protein